MSDLQGFKVNAPKPPPRETVLPAAYELTGHLKGKRHSSFSAMQISVLAMAVIAVVSTLVFSLVSTTTAKDSIRENAIGHCQGCLNSNYHKVHQARAVLEQTPQSEWTDEQVGTYLTNVVWSVGCEMYVFRSAFDKVCLSLDDLVSLEYIPEVPGNPFNDWKPMTLAVDDASFSPGNLFILIPPLDFHSRVGDGMGNYDIRPLSFELGIFGPTVEFATPVLVTPVPENTWAIFPDGTYNSYGTVTETAAQSAEKREEWLKYKAEQAAKEKAGEKN